MNALQRILAGLALSATAAAMCCCTPRDDTSLVEGDPSENLAAPDEQAAMDPVLRNQLDAAQWQREDEAARSRQRDADGDFMNRWMNTD